jgi:hypothetical protein
MASVWVEAIGRSLEQALDLMSYAIEGCTDEAWEAPMWPVPAPDPDRQFLDSNWNPIADQAQRAALVERWVQRWSTPWSTAWHALEVFDYDIGGEFGPWAPPPPFAGHPHWRDLPNLPLAWSRAETLSYVDYCRGRARDVLAQMTEERASARLPAAHRYRGQPHAWIIAGLVGHTTEHASQIRQFITASSASPSA